MGAEGARRGKGGGARHLPVCRGGVTPPLHANASSLLRCGAYNVPVTWHIKEVTWMYRVGFNFATEP